VAHQISSKAGNFSGPLTPQNPDSFVDLSTTETDFNRPKAVVSLGNSKATPQHSRAACKAISTA
jgi:hypothetical protein